MTDAPVGSASNWDTVHTHYGQSGVYPVVSTVLCGVYAYRVTGDVNRVSCPKCRELIFYGPELVALRDRVARLEASMVDLTRLMTRALAAANKLAGMDPAEGGQ